MWIFQPNILFQNLGIVSYNKASIYKEVLVFVYLNNVIMSTLMLMLILNVFFLFIYLYDVR